jgi:hypothetical protein
VPKVHNKPIQSSKKGFKKKGVKQPKAALVSRTGLSGAPSDSVRCTTGQCPVHHWTVSGAPGSSTPNYSASGIRGGRSAIIHRTVRCSTGLSGVPAEQRSSAPTVVCRGTVKRYSAGIMSLSISTNLTTCPNVGGLRLPKVLKNMI